MRIAGIVLTLVGASVVAAGGIMMGVGLSTNSCRCFNPDSDDTGVQLFGPFIGAFMMGVGGSHVLAGAVLWGVGAQRPSRAVSGWALPSITAGPRAVNLRWAF
jgi:hypothetical protein